MNESKTTYWKWQGKEYELHFKWVERNDYKGCDVYAYLPVRTLLGTIEAGKYANGDWKVINATVVDEFQGQGLGTILYKELFKKLKGQTIYSDTAINSRAVHKIWKKIGAEKIRVGGKVSYVIKNVNIKKNKIMNPNRQFAKSIREFIEDRQSIERGESVVNESVVNEATRSLSAIAQEIYKDWGSKISPHAKPYLEAMATLDSINDNYFMDSGRSVVLYFLSNANTWKGDTARRIKKELKAML